MRHLIRLLACSVLLAALAVTAFPQDGDLTPEQQREKARIEAYTDYYNKRQAKDNAGAYEVAKKFIQDYPTPADQYFNAVKKFVTDTDLFNKQQRRKAFYDALKTKRFDDAFAASAQVLEDFPQEELQLNFDLAKAGWIAAEEQKNTKNNAATIVAANKTLELVAAGKTVKTPADRIKGDTNYALGSLSEKPEDQVGYFVKAAQTAAYAKDAGLYFDLAIAYQEGEYTKHENAYNAIRNKSVDDPEVKTALKAYQESADRLIDSLARAITFATPAEANIKKDCTTLITVVYKFRNKSDAGLQPFIASIPARPLPQPGQPIDYFPPPAPVATTGTGATGTNGGTGTMPATTTPAGTTASATPGAKPAPAPKPKAGKKPAKKPGK